MKRDDVGSRREGGAVRRRERERQSTGPTQMQIQNAHRDRGTENEDKLQGGLTHSLTHSLTLSLRVAWALQSRDLTHANCRRRRCAWVLQERFQG